MILFYRFLQGVGDLAQTASVRASLLVCGVPRNPTRVLILGSISIVGCGWSCTGYELIATDEVGSVSLGDSGSHRSCRTTNGLPAVGRRSLKLGGLQVSQ